MDAKLTFRYDRVGDILYVETRPPYPEQDSEELEVLFFSTRLLRGECFDVPLRATLWPAEA